MRAACEALATGRFPDPVALVLPRGQRVEFALARERLDGGVASAAVVKDAGDDPDVTHGVLVEAAVRPLPPGSGVRFRAGDGVGTVTLPGLPIPVGEPAITPVPRRMMREAVEEAGGSRDVEITVSIPGGRALAERTLNGRLGIVGGLSVLGTTGVVLPYSCGAWIASIRRGVDVARAAGLRHVAAATGSVSEQAVARELGLPEQALIDMGDFAGGLLKHLRSHPVPRLTLAGGFVKMAKLAEGRMDLHSRRGAPDLDALLADLRALGAPPAVLAEAGQHPTGALVLEAARRRGLALADRVASRARAVARSVVGPEVEVEVRIYDRLGVRHGHAPF